MLRVIFGAILIVIGINLNAQNTVNRKIAQRYDEYQNNAWVGKDSAVFGYNTQGLESDRLLVQGLGNNMWNNFLRNTSTYDAIGNITSRRTEIWTNNAWQNSTLYTYSYNSANSQTNILYQTWNTSTSSWGNTGKIENTYNSNQDLTKRIAYQWVNNAWEPTTKQDYDYNASNVLLTKFSYTYVNGNWQRFERWAYQFAFGFVSNLERSVDDNNGGWRVESRVLSAINGSATPARISSERTQRRDTANAIWVDSLRTTYGYTSNLLSQKTRDSYNKATTNWTDIDQYQYAYNNSNLLSEEIYFSQGSSTPGLQPDARKTLSYNGNNLLDEIKVFAPASGNNWTEISHELLTYNGNDSLTYKKLEDKSGANYTPTEQYFYYYDNVSVGLSEVENLFTTATLYPNPAINIIKVKTDEKIDGTVVANIFTSAGKRVWSQISNKPLSNLEFDISDLVQGPYILQLSELKSGRSSTFKFQVK